MGWCYWLGTALGMAAAFLLGLRLGGRAATDFAVRRLDRIIGSWRGD